MNTPAVRWLIALTLLCAFVLIPLAATAIAMVLLRVIY